MAPGSTAPATQQAFVIAYFTGLRPYEVCAVREGDISHENLSMMVRVTKTRKNAHTRQIAIPAVLSAWIMNHGFQKMSYNNTRKATLTIQTGNAKFNGFCMETFRHNFSNMMRLAGVPRDTVDLHQGRATNVQDRNYNTEDPMFAANIMRPHIQAVFGAAVRAVR
jgi:integrase